MTITSTPSDRARATSSTAVIAQSAVISRPTPSAASARPTSEPGRSPPRSGWAGARRVGAQHAQRAHEDSRRGHPVDVVVAVDEDPRAAPHVVEHQVARDIDALELGRIVGLVRGQEPPRVGRRGAAAAHEHGRGGGRQPQFARDRVRGGVRVGLAVPA